MGELLPLTPGPHSPDLDPELWRSGPLRPSQPGLPEPTLDISLLLRDVHVARDDGLSAALECASKVRDALAPRTRTQRLLSRQFGKRLLRSVAWRQETVTVVEAAVSLPVDIARDEALGLHLTSALDSAIALTRQLVLTASSESHQPRLMPALELLPPSIPYLVGEHREGALVLQDSAIGMIGNAAHLSWEKEESAREEPIGFPGVYESYQSLRNDAEVAL